MRKKDLKANIYLWITDVYLATSLLSVNNYSPITDIDKVNVHMYLSLNLVQDHSDRLVIELTIM